jgi:2'-5' RNA ligase
MPSVRAFIAIELSEDVLSQVARLQARVRQDLPPGLVRWVRPGGIHLTLKFLGDVERAYLPEIEHALREACASHAPFILRVDGLGCFPNPRRPRVVWIGVQDDGQALGALQRAVEQAIAPLGFPTERRGFHPHLTLGRVKNGRKPAELEALGAYAERAKVRAGQMHVDRVHLMQSDLLPSGAVYTSLAAIPLTTRKAG